MHKFQIAMEVHIKLYLKLDFRLMCGQFFLLQARKMALSAALVTNKMASTILTKEKN